MKPNWIVEYLQSHDFEFQYNVGADELSEVWKNNKYIFVVHPEKGIQLIYHLSLFNEDYREDIIGEDLYHHDQIMASKNRSPN